MIDSVGVNRRMFDEGRALDDQYHVQRYQETKRAKIDTDGLVLPISKFEHEISDGTEKLFTHREILYELKEPNALGKKPAYIKDKLDRLVPFGLVEQQMGTFPYNLRLMQQKQFEKFELEGERPKQITINGKQYVLNNVAESVAKTL